MITQVHINKVSAQLPVILYTVAGNNLKALQQVNNSVTGGLS